MVVERVSLPIEIVATGRCNGTVDTSDRVGSNAEYLSSDTDDKIVFARISWREQRVIIIRARTNRTFPFVRSALRISRTIVDTYLSTNEKRRKSIVDQTKTRSVHGRDLYINVAYTYRYRPDRYPLSSILRTRRDNIYARTYCFRGFAALLSKTKKKNIYIN